MQICTIKSFPFLRRENSTCGGALVSIIDENQKEIARGLSNMNSNELKGAIGKKGVGEAVHRDNLVILS